MFSKQYTVIAKNIGKTCDRLLVEALHSGMRIQAVQRVLDLGCGSGGEAAGLSGATGAIVFGLDMCIDMLALAKDNIAVVNSDVCLTPFQAGAFDHIYSVNVLQLLSDRIAFFQEVKRLLTPGGKAGFPVPIPEQIQNRYVNQFFPNLAEVESSRYPSISTLAHDLDAAGLQVCSSNTIYLGTTIINDFYLKRLKNGVLSGLLFLSAQERESGLIKLEAAIREFERDGNFPVLYRYRTLLIARKE